jgi:hypothetical protein
MSFALYFVYLLSSPVLKPRLRLGRKTQTQHFLALIHPFVLKYFSNYVTVKVLSISFMTRNLCFNHILYPKCNIFYQKFFLLMNENIHK